jgi:hypothetical protein
VAISGIWQAAEWSCFAMCLGGSALHSTEWLSKSRKVYSRGTHSCSLCDSGYFAYLVGVDVHLPQTEKYNPALSQKFFSFFLYSLKYLQCQTHFEVKVIDMNEDCISCYIFLYSALFGKILIKFLWKFPDLLCPLVKALSCPEISRRKRSDRAEFFISCRIARYQKESRWQRLTLCRTTKW